MSFKRLLCAGAQFDTIGGFVDRFKAFEKAGRHPFFQHQPSAQINAAYFFAAFIIKVMLHFLAASIKNKKLLQHDPPLMERLRHRFVGNRQNRGIGQLLGYQAQHFHLA